MAVGQENSDDQVEVAQSSKVIAVVTAMPAAGCSFFK
jgi:hypothetical protein